MPLFVWASSAARKKNGCRTVVSCRRLHQQQPLQRKQSHLITSLATHKLILIPSIYIFCVRLCVSVDEGETAFEYMQYTDVSLSPSNSKYRLPHFDWSTTIYIFAGWWMTSSVTFLSRQKNKTASVKGAHTHTCFTSLSFLLSFFLNAMHFCAIASYIRNIRNPVDNIKTIHSITFCIANFSHNFL